MSLFQDTQQQLLSNPLNILLLLLALYLLFPLLKTLLFPSMPPLPAKIATTPDSYSWLPEKYPATRVWKTFTPMQLRPYDGQINETILFAVNRKVFDVSGGKSFYGPGGPYENFAGRDASRGMAKQSFDEDMLTPIDQPIDDLADLSASERDNMRDWEQHFMGKYILCGELVDP